jgi:hypothetical protein
MIKGTVAAHEKYGYWLWSNNEYSIIEDIKCLCMKND